MPQAPPVELLSPAGDWEALRAAVANGADAVYFGLDNYNARHRAANFTRDELSEIIAYLHGHNVKGFLTFNTLIFSDELAEAAEYVKAIAGAGVDAVIVQDLGLTRLIHALAPTLPIHGSTQMTLTEPRGIAFVHGLGVSRVILARELSIVEIRRIRENLRVPVELEAFVHGALCVAYSGQCLTSESIGGRSANRGQCAQACRLPYDLVVDGKLRDLGDKAYLLSPQDLAGYDRVSDLAGAGVSCLKIEGRLKSAHYVAATTQTYRRAIDGGAGYRITLEQRGDLEQTFSRGFSRGFLDGVDHQALVTARFPKSRGRRIGTVASMAGRAVVVAVEGNAPLVPGDGVVFDEGHPEQDEQGGRLLAARRRGRGQLEIEFRAGDVNIRAIAVGSIVWKTDDPALRKRLEHSFSRDEVVRRMPLRVSVRAVVGEPLTMTFDDGSASASVTGDAPLETARKFPADEAMLREQLDRLGDTPYSLGELDATIEGGPMVPKSLINDLRRKGVAELVVTRRERGRHTIVTPDALASLRAALPRGETPADPSLHLLVRTLDQLRASLGLPIASVTCDFEGPRRYGEGVAMARQAGVKVALATPRIIKPHEDGLLRQVLAFAPDAILVRNLAGLGFYREVAGEMPLIGDYALNIANELTAGILHESGLIRMVPSYDLSWSQLGAMVKRFDASRFEVVVHQHMPMFHMEHCVFAHTLSSGHDYRDCGRPCEKHRVDLRDRVGQPHPLIPDVGCRNTVFNAQAQSAAEYIPRMRELGIAHFRVELLRERADEVAPLVRRYADLLAGKVEPRAAMRSLRVLNQLGVTAGTLQRE